MNNKHPHCYIAPGVTLVGDVQLARGASLWFGVSLRADDAPIRIGTRSNVQDNAVLVGSVQIGQGVTIGHQVCLSSCTISDHSLVGIQAVVETGAHIGRWCVVGAGARVPEGMQIPDGSLAVGNPARVVRRVQLRDRLVIYLSAWLYRYNGWRYRRRLQISADQARSNTYTAPVPPSTGRAET